MRIVFYKNNKVINIEQVVGELFVDGNSLSWNDKKIRGVNSPYLLLEDETVVISIGDILSSEMILELDNQMLNRAKEKRMEELDKECSIAIINGFDYTINTVSYHFSCSISAQANFQGTDTLFKDGAITQAEWTVVDNVTGRVERVWIDKATFNSLKLEVFNHINSNVSRLRNTLQPQVESVTITTDLQTALNEVNAIVWQ